MNYYKKAGWSYRNFSGIFIETQIHLKLMPVSIHSKHPAASRLPRYNTTVQWLPTPGKVLLQIWSSQCDLPRSRLKHFYLAGRKCVVWCLTCLRLAIARGLLHLDALTLMEVMVLMGSPCQQYKNHLFFPIFIHFGPNFWFILAGGSVKCMHKGQQWVSLQHFPWSICPWSVLAAS